MSGDPFWHAIRARGLSVAPAVLGLHAGQGTKRYIGQCDITRGQGPLVRLILGLAGFPPAGSAVPTRLMITTAGAKSRWQRDFGGYITTSHLSYAAGRNQIIERFGPIVLHLSPRAEGGQLLIGVAAMRVFGLPVPRALLPVSATSEAEAPNGAFHFNVTARAPLVGFLISYTGELRPE